MAIANRAELIETLALIGLMGAARNGDLDAMFGVTPVATTSVVGGVKQTTAIVNQAALTVTDIATAQTAVTALVAKVNALLAAQRVSGQLAP